MRGLRRAVEGARDPVDMAVGVFGGFSLIMVEAHANGVEDANVDFRHRDVAGRHELGRLRGGRQERGGEEHGGHSGTSACRAIMVKRAFTTLSRDGTGGAAGLSHGLRIAR